jgi:phosphatidylserine/phosphatidylglycerophosphate/cardiolipin synthase-like enzyme
MPEARQKLIEALGARRLVAPFGELAVARYIGKLAAAEIAPEIERLAALGLTAELFTEMLKAFETDRAQAATLVWTGPDDTAGMRDTGVVVRELFSRAERHVLVAGFAVYQGHAIFEELAARMDAITELEVDMYLNVNRKYGDTTASEQILAAFARRFRESIWPRERTPSVYYDPRALEIADKRAALHAKCVVTDREYVLVTSANFTEAAQERNIEVGLLVRDEAIGEQLCLQFRALVERGDLRRVPV